jgi:hypothetical protein
MSFQALLFESDTCKLEHTQRRKMRPLECGCNDKLRSMNVVTSPCPQKTIIETRLGFSDHSVETGRAGKSAKETNK